MARGGIIGVWPYEFGSWNPVFGSGAGVNIRGGGATNEFCGEEDDDVGSWNPLFGSGAGVNIRGEAWGGAPPNEFCAGDGPPKLFCCRLPPKAGCPPNAGFSP